MIGEDGAHHTWDETVVWDEDHFWGLVGGDEDFGRDVLSLFKDQFTTYLDALEEADGTWRSCAHKLKGAARSIGAWRLAVQAERLEEMTEPARGTDARRSTLEDLEERYQALLKEISARGPIV